ncbi:hypothetical protein JCM11491_001318 [Sporobolomyces phaffii]
MAEKPAPVYSQGILGLLSVPTFATPAVAFAAMREKLANPNWPQDLPEGFGIAAAVELKGVCVSVAGTVSGQVKLEVVAHQGAFNIDSLRFDHAAQVLTVDGADIDYQKFNTDSSPQSVPTGTRLYAKRMIVFRRIERDPNLYDQDVTQAQAYWGVYIAKFLTLKQNMAHFGAKASSKTIDDKVPKYSDAVLTMIGAGNTGLMSSAEATSLMQKTLSTTEWQKKWPTGFKLGAVELTGVCLKTLRSDANNHVKLEIVTAQNTTTPESARIDATSKNIDIDGKHADYTSFDSRSHDGLHEGTLLYAKRLIAYRQVDPARDHKKFDVSWQIAIGKFLTLDALCDIDDWAALP